MIGLLTGTFDPTHLGHVELARAARRELGLSEVWLLVNAKRVDSPVERKEGVGAYEHRRAMAELAIRDEPGISVYSGALAEQPHTMETFFELMRRAEERFVFIVGMDVIARLDGWEDVESVVRDTSFAVARRPGVAVDAVDGLRRRLGSLGGRLDAREFAFDEYVGVSSGRVRAALSRGERPVGLDARVAKYIAEQGLYR